MHDGRTREIVERSAEGIHHERALAAVHQPATAPSPMAGYRIDQYADQYGVSEVHGEFGTFRHGSGDDGGRRGAKYGLEDQESLDR